MTVNINSIAFTMLPEKALYKHDERLLIIADTHLGKASHFRKAGIPISAGAQLSDYENLEKLIRKTAPLAVYFLGDLFHSTYNNDWLRFCSLVGGFPTVKFTLIKGNHDMISVQHFDTIGVDVVDFVEDDRFLYTHDAVERVPSGKMNITGHVHPGIALYGYGRQSAKLPCFYFCNDLMILPAFGVFTGLYNMKKTERTEIYAVLPDEVLRIP